MKIIASDLPASGFLSYLPARMRSASAKRFSISSREKSGMARKWRDIGRLGGWAVRRMGGRLAIGRMGDQGPASFAQPPNRRSAQPPASKNILPQVLVFDDRLEAI